MCEYQQSTIYNYTNDLQNYAYKLHVYVYFLCEKLLMNTNIGQAYHTYKRGYLSEPAEEEIHRKLPWVSFKLLLVSSSYNTCTLILLNWIMKTQ